MLTWPRCKQLSVGMSAAVTAATASHGDHRAQAAATLASSSHTMVTIRRHSRQQPQQNSRLMKNQTVT